MTTATIGSTEQAEGDRAGGGLLRWTVAILVLEPLLMFAAFFVLNSAINWPASLDEPARVNLPIVLEQRGAVVVGYGAYLAYSLLILPLSVMLYFLLKERGSSSPLLAVAAGVGIISALARALGISRWLFLMPLLAETYVAPGTTEASRQAVEVVYDAFNEYAGGVGELLGVTLTGCPLARANFGRPRALREVPQLARLTWSSRRGPLAAWPGFGGRRRRRGAPRGDRRQRAARLDARPRLRPGP